MSDLQTFDLTHALANMGDDLEIYEEVASAFFSDTPNLLMEMKDAIQKNDAVTVNRLAHSIKSSSRTIGGLKLGEVAAILESETGNSNISNASSLLDELENQFIQLKDIIKKENLNIVFK